MRKSHPLRQMVLAGAITVSTVVLLLTLKPHTDPALAQSGATPTDQVTVAAAPSTSSSLSSSPSPSTSPSKAAAKHTTSSPTPSAPHSTTAAPARTSSTPSAPKTTSAAPTTRSVTGSTVQTKYGPVQVRITLTGGRITGATAVQSPSSPARSQEISSMAVPKLNQETLAAQSANIDSVSGASYTSQGYKQSLQSALDRAGV
ncbi:FMN-binding protein [Streptomyces sp. NPDC007264]|uniref:FMN-binding protein n=1 Tax=Streptomyces sp. NPDC007264 TaxID=3364777 RepID=UPI0036DE2ACE